jgi:hypothetical protein
MQHWSDTKDRIRYVLTRTTAKELRPYVKLAVMCMEQDIQKQQQPLDHLSQARLVECIKSDQIIWMKYVFLQACCCSSTLFQRYLVPFCLQMNIEQWLVLLKREFVLYLCGTRDIQTKQLLYPSYVDLVKQVITKTIEF